MKSLSDVKQDMSKLYDEVESGKTELKLAAELANIAGKYLKAEQLELARDIFQAAFPTRVSHVAKALTRKNDRLTT